ncbi:MAG: Gmad2 immunoglobulin-like domain-containing protein [Chloroflexota bacterium]
MRGRRLVLFILLIPFSLSCSFSMNWMPTPTPTFFVFPTETAVLIPPLTSDMIRNMDYTLQDFNGNSHAYRLTDGVFQGGADPAAVDFVSVVLGEQIVFGDLNDDGAEDAATTIAINFGGTGVFVSVAAVVNENGKPRHAASWLIDDRPRVNDLRIQNGTILVDAVIHGPNDPGCCPAQPVTQTYRLTASGLTLVRATSKTPGGLERAIVIESPFDGSEVSGAVRIQGNVTIAPFENNLSYRIYNGEGNEIAAGPLMVSAPDLGAPGTFDSTLDLAAFPPGPILLVIADFSAADGSVLAMDSVRLVVR